MAPDAGRSAAPSSAGGVEPGPLPLERATSPLKAALAPRMQVAAHKALVAARPVAGSLLSNLRARLPASLRNLPTWLLLLGVGLVLALPVVAVVMLSRAPSNPRNTTRGGGTTPTATPLPPPLPPSETASEQQFAQAIALGPGAVEALLKQFPKDTRVHHALVHAYTVRKSGGKAMHALAALLALNPAALNQPETVQAIHAAASWGDSDTLAAIDALLAAQGERGVDILIELTDRLLSPRKEHFSAILSKPAVRAKASPATLVLLDVRAAANCPTRHKLLPRAQQFGDRRVLVYLKGWTVKRGCGFFRNLDCHACLRRDTGLLDAIKVIEIRVGSSN